MFKKTEFIGKLIGTIPIGRIAIQFIVESINPKLVLLSSNKKALIETFLKDKETLLKYYFSIRIADYEIWIRAPQIDRVDLSIENKVILYTKELLIKELIKFDKIKVFNEENELLSEKDVYTGNLKIGDILSFYYTLSC